MVVESPVAEDSANKAKQDYSSNQDATVEDQYSASGINNEVGESKQCLRRIDPDLNRSTTRRHRNADPAKNSSAVQKSSEKPVKQLLTTPGKNCNAPQFVPGSRRSLLVATTVEGPEGTTYLCCQNSSDGACYFYPSSISTPHLFLSNRYQIHSPAEERESLSKEAPRDNNALDETEGAINDEGDGKTKSVIRKDRKPSKVKSPRSDKQAEIASSGMAAASVEILPSQNGASSLATDGSSGKNKMDNEEKNVAMKRQECVDQVVLRGYQPYHDGETCPLPPFSNAGDLFLNPAFVGGIPPSNAQLQSGFLSFVSDSSGALVGSTGELYCGPYPGTGGEFILVDQDGNVPPPPLISPTNDFGGPATIRMVSTNSSPPLPLPMTVPPGHMVQQVLDQNGTLQHVILGPDPMTAAAMTGSSSGAQPVQSGTHMNNSADSAAPTLQSVVTPTSSSRLVTNGSSNASPPQFQTPVIYASGPINGPPGPPPPGCSNPRQAFPNTHYGPPPGAPIVGTGTAGMVSVAQIPSPSSHGASPTPSSGSSGHPPGYPTSSGYNRARAREDRLKKPRRNHPQMSSLSTTTPPPTSPAKRGGGSRGGNSGIGVVGGTRCKSNSHRQQEDSEESGVGHEEEEEIQQLLIELLSNIRTPKVSEIQATSALLKWGPPTKDHADPKFEALDHITEDADFRYEVSLSDKGKDGKYRSIFYGGSIECRLTDLRPCTEYHIRIYALYENLKGGASDTVSFVTDRCEPDQPAPPKLGNRSKTSLNLRWNACADNGAHIQLYVLESDGGNGITFSEIFKGRSKSYNVTKLHSSTSYRFRLYAVNELGKSRPSDTVSFTTQGTAPPQPEPPGLKEATKSSLHLVWSKRLCDNDFTLHMDDRISGHGFLPMYNGSDVQHICNGLRRNAPYRFRLQASNDEGKSCWSEEVTYLTLPDKPGPPLRPASKGRLHSSSFKVRWDAPSDDGGSSVTNYILEIDDGRGWQTVYRGSDLECICDNLSPGTQFKVRVACTSEGGVSEYSDLCHICTEPVCPGQCAPPRPHGKPKATFLHLKWGWPESDGGSEVTEFEIDMTSPDNHTRAVYRGRDTECVVASLLPGRPYLFQVRAHNRAGPGPWSDSLEVVSGAGAPDPPNPPVSVVKSATTARLEWECPINNGAVVTEFKLQLAMVATKKCLPPPARSPVPPRRREVGSDSYSSDSSSGAVDVNKNVKHYDDETTDDESAKDSEHEDGDDESHDGHQQKHQRKVRRKKKTGSHSNFEEGTDSEEVVVEDVSEDAFSKQRNISNRTSVSNQDQEGALNGRTSSSTANHHQRDAGERFELVRVEQPKFASVYSGTQSSFEARNLHPATRYLFRVCASNSAGTSGWSKQTELATPATAPAAVNGIRLQSTTATSLTLEWNRPVNNGEIITHYIVDNLGHGATSTGGPATLFTIDSLTPDTTYTIRVQAVNSVGPGPFSNPANKFTTRPLPPASPKFECVNANHNSLKLKWGDAKSVAAMGEVLQFTLEMENSRKQFHVVYNGPGLSHKIPKLQENNAYKFRLCASNMAGQGPFSETCEFRTAYAHPPTIKACPRVTSITEDGCTVEWSQTKASTPQREISYKVQLTRVKEKDVKIIYTGSDTQFRVNGLDSRTEYSIRVGCVRVPSPDTELLGAFSPPTIFATGAASSLASDSSSQPRNLSRPATFFPRKGDKTWTDQQWAVVILVGFTFFALCIAVVLQQVIAWGIVSAGVPED